MLDEARYEQLASAALRRILAAADTLDPDLLEADSTGEMVTLSAPSREKCIVNTQRAVRQLWVAGGGQGVHFSYDDASGTWKDDKGRGLELFRFVADVVNAISGVDLVYPG